MKSIFGASSSSTSNAESTPTLQAGASEVQLLPSLALIDEAIAAHKETLHACYGVVDLYAPPINGIIEHNYGKSTVPGDVLTNKLMAKEASKEYHQTYTRSESFLYHLEKQVDSLKARRDEYNRAGFTEQATKYTKMIEYTQGVVEVIKKSPHQRFNKFDSTKRLSDRQRQSIYKAMTSDTEKLIKIKANAADIAELGKVPDSKLT